MSFPNFDSPTNTAPGGWDIHFVELEPPSSKLFNKDGTPGERLRKAIYQLDCWRSYVGKHRVHFAEALRDAAMRYGIGPSGKSEEPTCNASMPITDPRSAFHFRHQIIIGRRGTLKAEELERKNAYKQEHSAEVITYDRLIDASERLARAERRPKENYAFPVETD